MNTHNSLPIACVSPIVTLERLGVRSRMASLFAILQLRFPLEPNHPYPVGHFEAPCVVHNGSTAAIMARDGRCFNC